MRKIITIFFALALSVSPAFAGGTLTLMGIGPSQYVPPFSFELISSSAGTSYTGSYGTSAATKVVVGVVVCKSNVTNASVTATLDGVSMTQIKATGNSGSQSYVATVVYGIASAGSGTFTAACGSVVSISTSLFAVNNPSSTTPVSCTGTISCTLTPTTSGGAIFGGVASGSAANGVTAGGFSSGIVTTNLSGGFSGATAYGAALGGSDAVSLTVTNSFRAFAAASWR